MTCQELVELVTDRFDSALGARERAAFDAHVAICADCGRYVEQLRETIRLAGIS